MQRDTSLIPADGGLLSLTLAMEVIHVKRPLASLPKALRYTFLSLSIVAFAACSGGGGSGPGDDISSSAENPVQDEAQIRNRTLSDANFIYTNDELLTFDVKAYLQKHYPVLADHASGFTHWSGFTTVSPKVLISLIVMQNLVDGQFNTALDLDKPFGNLSEKTGFNEQLADVATRLSSAYYQAKKAGVEHKGDYAIQQLLTETTGGQTRSSSTRLQYRSFDQSFFDFFPEESVEPTPRALPDSGAQGQEAALQIPSPIGESWIVSGASHNAFGQVGGVLSSLDFIAPGSPGEGGNTSGFWVTAAHGGTVSSASDCGLVLVGDNGWSTSYYHLSNIQVSPGQRVTANTRLANYANNRTQALCEGGGWSGPHVHFTLMKNNQLFSLDGVELSGYRVHNGQKNYDDDCSHFYLTNNGARYCAHEPLYNGGATVSDPDPEPPQPAGPSEITAPQPGTELTSSSTTFEWQDTQATLFVLSIGTRSGGYSNDIFYEYLSGNTTSVTVDNLPIDGRKLYLRLWSRDANYEWHFFDASYQTVSGEVDSSGPESHIISPEDGSYLSGSDANFYWQNVNARQYILSVGTEPGGYSNDLYYEYLDGGTTSAYVDDLPADGGTIYVRLWTQNQEGQWYIYDASYVNGG